MYCYMHISCLATRRALFLLFIFFLFVAIGLDVPLFVAVMAREIGVTGSWDRVWEHPMDRGKFGEPAHTLTYDTF